MSPPSDGLRKHSELARAHDAVERLVAVIELVNAQTRYAGRIVYHKRHLLLYCHAREQIRHSFRYRRIGVFVKLGSLCRRTDRARQAQQPGRYQFLYLHFVFILVLNI